MILLNQKGLFILHQVVKICALRCGQPVLVGNQVVDVYRFPEQCERMDTKERASLSKAAALYATAAALKLKMDCISDRLMILMGNRTTSSRVRTERIDAIYSGKHPKDAGKFQTYVMTTKVPILCAATVEP